MPARPFAAVLAAGLALALTGPARADEPHATVDWSKGLLTAPGIGLADRQAPNPAVARGPSRRRAEDAAKATIAEALPALPLATGGRLADKLTDPAIKARIDAAVAAALTLSADPETDGSWTVTMAVPLEAVHQALTGPRALPTTGDTGPAIAILDGVTARPSIGFTVGGLPAATLWSREVPPWAKSAPHIKARSTKDGAIDADVGKATAATLFVIVQK